MKLTKDILRQIITEEIVSSLTEETEAKQRDRAIQQISGILSHLANTNINAQDVLNKAKEQFEKSKTAGLNQDPLDGEMGQDDPLGEGCGNMQSIDMGVGHDNDDHEGSMAKRQMFKTAQYAADIFDMIEEGEELPAWIQSKMTKIADYIGAVKHYLEYDEVMDVPGNRSEKKWSDADHDKQEKIAKEIEKENPGISKEKKMAFAGAQVNREKRKRNK
jgi:hypothetical protein